MPPAQHRLSEPDADQPETWEPPVPLRKRLVRALLVPARAGAVVVVLAVLIAIAMVWLRPHTPHASGADPAVGEAAAINAGDASTERGAEAGGGAAGIDGGVADGSDSANERIFVHVVGEVARPGVIELPADARVDEALERAGGATEAAVLSALNLARVVSDGEQIVVPDAEGAEQMLAAPAPAADGTGAGGGAAGGDGAGTVDLNAADAAALETLPRVGPALAQRILDWRQANGRFQSVDQLLEVSGIGAKTLEGFRDRVTV